ncbi:MAG: bifunctional folylpolyglutamate synthase/dihydrofolate synthase [Wenzhouxiangella sp.]|nr:bifunctional folylpolyglutamate synthase/dihydrofolate synthase [Wenzhouxiangella sp.]MCH8477504.1 bifunctional folylpolyglutamate synthase/dihydrofolate synthase [Wenzhouxiangella sp.]TVR96895.1 MAG: bifunctional folylpolyglutamate synthase/dihydrofolate synthase [Wenzhouxiangellaceae bacterium]
MIGSELAGWLARLEQRTPEARIELGLDRVRQVLQRLNPALDGLPVITVAGTNGKGSTVAYLEAMASAAGHRSFAYTSPHLLRFAERMRIQGQPANDDAIAEALARVEAVRAGMPLTYFEHITLAALDLAARSAVDLLILEVGLGGRLDAVNVVDPDVAVITSIGLDHVEWLGKTRLAIGREKAGIARPGRPLIVAERRLPAGLSDVLEAGGARLLRSGREYRVRRHRSGFRLRHQALKLELPIPALGGACQVENAAAAALALLQLGEPIVRDPAALARGIRQARLAGRQEVLSRQPLVMIDVAHNAAAARVLASSLGPAEGRSVAVFAALADKDVEAMAKTLDVCFDHWIVTGLAGVRALPVELLANRLGAVPVAGSVETVKSPPSAVRRALEFCGRGGRVVVFGSFHTIAEAWPELEKLG